MRSAFGFEGGVSNSTANDAKYQPQLPGLVVPAFLDNLVIVSLATSPANSLRLCRAIVPRTGRLRDLIVYVGTSSGNYIGSVYDSGDADAADARTLLWTSGSQPCGAANGWRIIGDPNLAVVAGQHLELGVMADNTTASLGRVQVSASGAQLPAGFGVSPGGVASGKLFGAHAAASFAAPASIADADIGATTTNLIVLGARIS
jgi:hypothetical protein